MPLNDILIFTSITATIAFILAVYLQRKHAQSFDHNGLSEKLAVLLHNDDKLQTQLAHLLTQQQQDQQHIRERLDKQQIEHFKQTQDHLSMGLNDISKQLMMTLQQNAKMIGQNMQQLTDTTHHRLKEIGNQVDTRLNEGFEKTTATFTDVVKRLALIDKAQQEITKLSTNVVSLQEVLRDNKARGAFGEVQLSALVRNMLPESQVAFQHTLSNGKRADCILFLPEPTGNVVIDAKFPLDNFRKIQDSSYTEQQKQVATTQFRQDIKKHIHDICDKYILPGETSDGAVMFIPAEAVFAEIHAHHSDIVTVAHQKNVWLVSPTTMMAILTTARAVLKDAATRKQVHLIQQHLQYLSKDFDRFQTRMNQLSKHIAQAHEDVEKVNKSSSKITSRFEKIERVELDQTEVVSILEEVELE